MTPYAAPLYICGNQFKCKIYHFRNLEMLMKYPKQPTSRRCKHMTHDAIFEISSSCLFSGADVGLSN